MATASRTLMINFASDCPPGSHVKVCGSVPELGSWKLEDGVSLTWHDTTSHHTATVTIESAPAPAPLTVEYKLAVRKRNTHPDGTYSFSEWEWQPGPNRRAAFPAISGGTGGAAATSPSATGRTQMVKETWFHARDGTQVIDSDPYLESHREHLKYRYRLFSEALAKIDAHGGGLDAFSRGYEIYGFTRGFGPASSAAAPTSSAADAKVEGIWYREWAPGARAASLVGDFNGWDPAATPCTKDDFGVFSVFLADRADGTEAIAHDTFLKLSLVLADGSRVTRVPAWTRYAVYDSKLNEYVAKYWNPPPGERHAWTAPRPRTGQAEDYTRVPGISPVASRTNWLGKVSPAEAERYGIEEMSAAGGAGTAAAAASAPAPATSGAAASSPSAYAVSLRKAWAPSHERTATESWESAGASDPCAAGLRIYEAHVGMGGEEGKVSSYREFARDVLPRIKRLGYNCVQFMAIMEHAYYGSFGYHVNQFLAPSSRFGTPEDLKFMVDTAHNMGLLVIMDCVHSHASKNVNDGLNMFDGTDYQYFHAGEKGSHALWDSRLFDYSKFETQRLLLSSLRLFVEEFRFDGFRFDGVTSMMYHHHGLSYGFSGDYNEYFGPNTDLSAVVYLMLANQLLHTVTPPCLSLAEDVSGMPTLCRPVWEGGVGFDARLAMAVPDKWIQFLKEKRDEEWDLQELVWTLTNRRWQEKAVTYAESHDQALVGDKTIAFWLMDKEMYWHMSALEQPRHPVVARGVALHKIIRLLTHSLGGEAYLNFMGNEFGHPEWIDFPREGNGWSYHHCRRQWHLVDDSTLLYQNLSNFDAGMQHLEDEYPWLVSRDNFVSTKNQGDMVIVYDRGTRCGPLVFAFNLHPTNSYTDYRIAVPCPGEWRIALDTDWKEFGGYGLVDRDTRFVATDFAFNGRPASMQIYLPARSALVFKLAK